MNSELFRLLIGQTLLHSCMTGLRLAIPLYLLTHQRSRTEVGFVVALIFIANVVLALPLGRLIDRYGLQWPWRAGVVLALFASLFCAVMPNVWGMSLGGLCVGASFSLGMLATQRYASLSVHNARQRSEVFGWIMLAPPAATLVGPLFVGLLFDYAGDTPTDLQSLVMVCVFLAVLALISMWCIYPLPNLVRSEATSHAHEGGQRGLLKDIRIVMALVLITITTTGWGGFLFLAPLLIHERGMSSSIIGICLGAFAMSAAMIRPLLPRLTAGMAEHRLVAVACVLSALMFALFPFMSSAWGYILVSFLLGLCLGCLQPMLVVALTAAAPPHQQGHALSLTLMTTGTCHLFVPIAFGAAGTMAGIEAIFWVAAFITAVGVLFAMKMKGS